MLHEMVWWCYHLAEQLALKERGEKLVRVDWLRVRERGGVRTEWHCRPHLQLILQH